MRFIILLTALLAAVGVASGAQEGAGPLHNAARLSDPQNVTDLIEAGADLEAEDAVRFVFKDY